MNPEFEHIPVLMNEIIDLLKCKKGSIVLDCTVGGGGHSSEILKIIGEEGYVYCLDKDNFALKEAEKKLCKVGENYQLIKKSYNDITDIPNLPKIDAMLADLGVSSYQLDIPERGFSFSKPADLDMRFDQNDNSVKTANYYVNKLSEKDLADVFFEYGEERFGRRIARAIVNYRQEKEITNTTELADIVFRSKPRNKKSRAHPATKVFQALRIKVNNELNTVKEAIPKLIDSLKIGGRLAIITFHSLEDRIVKNAFKLAAKSCVCHPRQPICNCTKIETIKLINRKPILANEVEIKQNIRSRSAKLRVVERIN